MKKVLLSASLLIGITATAQDYEKRVGINTDTPRASLEVKAIINGKAQGILFPHIDENEKARWAKDNAKGLVAGTVIWNTTKLCLDYFDGTNWQCTNGTKSNVHPTPWTPGATSFTGTAIWGDDAGETLSVSKNNCPTGQTGVAMNYPANTAQRITYTATSTVSQEDANQKAIALMNSAEKQQERQVLAQQYANANGTCQANTTTFTGTAIWGDDVSETLSVSKNNCPTGQTGVAMNYPANTAQRITYTATSTVSQEDANQKAIALMNSLLEVAKRRALAQEYANTNGTCQANTTTFTGTAVWGDNAGETLSVSKNNCPTGQTGVAMNYPANTAQRITYTATSTVSQEDANQKAITLMNSAEKQQERQVLAQNYANTYGTCQTVYNGTFSYTGTKEFTKNNCTIQQIGSKVTYTNPTPIVGTATSYVSQAEADRLARENAIAEFERLGQEEANRRGTCEEDVFALCRRILGDLNYDFAIAGGNASFNDLSHRTLLAKGINQPISWDKLREMWNEVPKGSYLFYIRTPDDGTSSNLRYVATVGDEYWIDNARKWVGFDNVKEGYAIRTHLGAAISQSGPPMTGDNATWKCQVRK